MEDALHPTSWDDRFHPVGLFLSTSIDVDGLLEGVWVSVVAAPDPQREPVSGSLNVFVNVDVAKKSEESFQDPELPPLENLADDLAVFHLGSEG